MVFSSILLLVLIHETYEWINDQGERFQARGESKCNKTTTLCCGDIVKEKRNPKLWDLYRPGISLIFGGHSQLVGPRHIHFQCCIGNPIEPGEGDREHRKYCAGPYGMMCPLAHRAQMIQLPDYVEYDAFDNSLSDNAIGVCMENEGYASSTIRAGSIGNLNVPIIKEGSENNHIYAWFTDTGDFEDPILTDWAVIMKKKVNLAVAFGPHKWNIQYGPAEPLTTYVVSIRSQGEKDSVMHVRLGPKGEDF